MKYRTYTLSLSVFCIIFARISAMTQDAHMRPEVRYVEEPRYGVPSEAHITTYLLAGKDLSNAVLATATFVAYRDVPYEKTANILGRHFFTHPDFKQLFKTDSTIIIFQNLTVPEEYRFKGFGSSLVAQAFQYLSSQQGNSIMVWHARPHGCKTLSLEKLCAFYKKYGGIMLGSDNECARFYKKF